MKMMRNSLMALTLLLTFCFQGYSQAYENTYLYKCVTVRAAPGKLFDLMDHLKKDLRAIKESGEEPGYMYKHWQGDQWDFFIMVPVGKYETYYKSKTAAIMEREYGSPYYDNVARQEEGFVRGPDLDLFRKTWQENTYFHAEMFQALGGKQKELYKERMMENAYYANKGGIHNMIFTRENGFVWDIFTLGGYRDFKHYADYELSEADSDAAARKAGFESSSHIGAYMRSLINLHMDTMGGKIDY